ncbi:hypothetical protein HZH66_013661 [Vespula vulgaris]|uniref:Ionotropic glutamate receptor L-glutamate and glycine-binding domain-containing protein n=1 Tax=Vespula vulgaris TaxID=7454 RepID=A0A834J876_VESVU|nr:hypothetical protein HZH66_013661 [Vespula vulgaris]
MTTLMYTWIKAFSRDGVTSKNLYFLYLHESLYYLGQIVQSYYIVLISNFNTINEFSLATSSSDMSSAVWLVILIYKKNGSDYCHHPPGNIFHLRFNYEMIVRCGTENILREWYLIDTNQMEINDLATWSLQREITKMVPDFLYERRFNLQGLIMRDSPYIIKKKDGEIAGIFGRIFREFCDILNFSFNIVSEVKEYGRWNPNEKTWSGGMAELYTGRADICISNFIINNDRLNATHYTISFLNSKIILVIREPENLTTFTLPVWIAVLGVLIASSIFPIFLNINSGTDHKIKHLLIDTFWRFRVYFASRLLFDLCKSRLTISLIRVADDTYQLTVPRGSAYYDRIAEDVMKLMLKDKELPISKHKGF